MPGTPFEQLESKVIADWTVSETDSVLSTLFLPASAGKFHAAEMTTMCSSLQGACLIVHLVCVRKLLFIKRATKCMFWQPTVYLGWRIAGTVAILLMKGAHELYLLRYEDKSRGTAWVQTAQHDFPAAAGDTREYQLRATSDGAIVLVSYTIRSGPSFLSVLDSHSLKVNKIYTNLI